MQLLLDKDKIPVNEKMNEGRVQPFKCNAPSQSIPDGKADVSRRSSAQTERRQIILSRPLAATKVKSLSTDFADYADEKIYSNKNISNLRHLCNLRTIL